MLEEEWFDAVQRGNDERVAELLITRPELLTSVLNGGCDALDIAAKEGHAKVVTRLLAAGAIPSGAMNALHYAAAAGCDDVVALLLEAKPDVIAKTCSMGWTALHYAVHHGHEKVFAQLLAAKPELIDEVCGGVVPRDSTVLHLAARNGHEDLLVQILALRPDMITAVDDLEWNAFRCAIDGKHQQVAERLLEIKPESVFKISKFFHRSILHCAARRDFKLEFIAKLWRMNPEALFHEDSCSCTPFYEAIARDRNDLIELFQWSLPLDVIASAFNAMKVVYEERYKPVIESLFEPLFAWLSQDVTGIVFEYLGFEFVTRPRKRSKFEVILDGWDEGAKS